MWKSNRPWPTPPFDEIRRRATILVVDDQNFPYEELFGRDGYNLTKQSDVENMTDLERGRYDVILLDLHGIGKQETKEEGLGVLRHLRTTSPAQIVVAYSAADWPLQYQPFFHLADAVLAKSADYYDFKRKVDELLISRFSLGFYVARVRSELGDTITDTARLTKLAEKAILSGDPSRLRRFLSPHLDSTAIDRVLQIINVAIQLASLWRH